RYKQTIRIRGIIDLAAAGLAVLRRYWHRQSCVSRASCTLSVSQNSSSNVPRISCTSSSNLAILYGIVLAADSSGGGACMDAGSAWPPSSITGAS
ncbi:hypothetical protein Tco_0193412, partial [Tanacetum coccineum]